MTHHQIIADEAELDKFISFLPEPTDTEVYYLCLFARHKYCAEFPNTKDNGQLVRVAARKEHIKEKIRKMEVPLGSYSYKNGVIAPQESLAVYIGLNPRSLVKANKKLLVELATRIADGDLNFNPISMATTAIHHAMSRKIFADFDYDEVDPADYLPVIKETLPADSFRILKTRGGFHLVVELDKAPKSKWYQTLVALPNCDRRGADNLTPVPGCVQGNFVPFFVEYT